MLWQTILIVVGIILFVFLLAFFLMIRFTKTVYKRSFDKRFNDNQTLKYFTADELNLNDEKIEFNTLDGTILRGHIFTDKEVNEYKGLLIVSHDIGAGHLPYMKEISYFAKAGYKVLAFDDKGCNESEGETFGGQTQALIDLDYCLKYVESNDELKSLPVVLYGHCMGAYASINVTSFNHPCVKGVVALAPFNNDASYMYEMVTKLTSMRQKIIFRAFKSIIKSRFKDYCKYSSLESLDQSNIPFYIIAGEEDQMVNFNTNYFFFKDVFENKEGFKFESLPEVGSKPVLSLEASKYDASTNDDLGRLQGEYKGNVPRDVLKKFYDELDYDKLYELNEELMSKIINFCNGCI